MGLIDLKRIDAASIYERKALNDWRHYCNLARLVAYHYPRIGHLGVLDACALLRKTD